MPAGPSQGAGAAPETMTTDSLLIIIAPDTLTDKTRRELIGGTETAPAHADHYKGRVGGPGGGSLCDGESDSELRGSRGGLLEDDSVGQPSGGVGTGRGRAPISFFINPPSGHSYVVDVTHL